jgi:hypothetical protein
MGSKSALILNSWARMSYSTLKSWLDDHAGEYRVAVLGPDNAAHLHSIVAPQSVLALSRGRTPPTSPLNTAWRHFIAALGRFDTVIVLCVSDDQALTGHAPLRLLGELLFSRTLVLIGPHCVKTWPGGTRLFHPGRARDMTALAAAGIMSVLTTTISLAAVALYEALICVRLVR